MELSGVLYWFKYLELSLSVRFGHVRVVLIHAFLDLVKCFESLALPNGLLVFCQTVLLQPLCSGKPASRLNEKCHY